MAPFVESCGENLRIWQERYSKLSVQTEPGDVNASSISNSLPPFQMPEDFLTAFPPTLPRSFLAQFENAGVPFDLTSAVLTRSSGSSPGSRRSSADSTSYSHYETCSSSSPSPPPHQPSHSVLAHLSRLEITASPTPSNGRAASITSASSFINPQDATAAIRAAYDASVRKKKSFHRSSWNPTPAEVSEVSGQPSQAHLPSSYRFGAPLPPTSTSTVPSCPLTPPSHSSRQSTLPIYQSVSSC